MLVTVSFRESTGFLTVLCTFEFQFAYDHYIYVIVRPPSARVLQRHH